MTTTKPAVGYIRTDKQVDSPAQQKAEITKLSHREGYTHIKTLLRHPVYLGWLTYGRRGAGLYAYYKCKRARVSGTCENYAVRTDLIEPHLTAWFRSVWQSEKGRQTLRKALTAFEQETIRKQPERRESLQTQMAKFEQADQPGNREPAVAGSRRSSGRECTSGQMAKRTRPDPGGNERRRTIHTAPI